MLENGEKEKKTSTKKKKKTENAVACIHWQEALLLAAQQVKRWPADLAIPRSGHAEAENRKLVNWFPLH